MVFLEKPGGKLSADLAARSTGRCWIVHHGCGINFTLGGHAIYTEQSGANFSPTRIPDNQEAGVLDVTDELEAWLTLSDGSTFIP